MASEYYKKVTQVNDFGAVSITLALAKEVGILSVLEKADGPLTSADIASKKTLKERYVREILGCLSGAELVHLNTNEHGENTYYMDEEQKQGLRMGFASPSISLVATMAQVYEKVKSCVHLSGPYGFAYEDIAQQTIEEYSGVVNDSRIKAILKSVPDLQKRLEDGIDVIEFGCGLGTACAALAQSFPKSRFTASELTEEYIQKMQARWSNIPNMSLEIVDMCNIDESQKERYDWAFCFNVLHDLPNPPAAFRGARSVLQHPGGVFTFVDVSPTENGTHQEAVGDLLVAATYARSTFGCIRESLQDEHSVALGACGGRTVIQGLAEQSGFEGFHEKLNDYHTLYVCRTV